MKGGFKYEKISEGCLYFFLDNGKEYLASPSSSRRPAYMEGDRLGSDVTSQIHGCLLL